MTILFYTKEKKVKFSIQKSYKVMMLTPAILGLGVLAMGSPAQADEVSELKAQLKALQQRIEVLEKRPVETQVVTATGDKAAAPAKPAQKGYFVIPGTETTMKIGGYAKLDAVYSDVSAADNNVADQLFLPFRIPLDSDKADDNQVVLHARQSRFNVGTTTDTAYGKLNTFFEGDFYGDPANATSCNTDFRLRHAYGELGKLLAGQTWTTFENMDSLADTVDFGGPAAHIFMRQGQIRWTEPFAWGSLQFAVEDPTATFDDNTTITADDQTDDDHFVDLIGRANFKSEYGSYSVAVMARELSVDNDSTIEDSEWGGAISLAGRIPTIGKDDLRFQLNYGNALGRYMTTKFKDAEYNVTTNEIETFDQWGGFLAYRHLWMDNLRSNLVYSYSSADNDEAVLGSVAYNKANKEFQSVHVNLIWSPVSQVDLGVEFLHGYREVESGADGDLNRIQFAATYNFF
jgi:hypothetical protein